jgi:hypothetical protein
MSPAIGPGWAVETADRDGTPPVISACADRGRRARRCRGPSLSSFVSKSGNGEASSRRDQGLARVQTWFAPALEADETLRAALAATPFRLTRLNSLVATAKELTGRNQGRVLLLTDRAIHVAGRRFWRRRFRVLFVSYPLGTVSVRYVGDGELRVGEDAFFLNPAGFQMGGVVGSAADIELFVAAGS